ncbi:hypothetical protein [Achromobacter sp. Root83]|uniref:hypothetical protein n=1 Tax=Achromobacter sp. Root83 TaxID=1736602 RepID=UPI000B005610|nr:hypothetical protein [Achromobacter sp. Root83]
MAANSMLQMVSGDETNKLGAVEKDQRVNLLVSILARIAGTLSPEQAATIATVVRLEA